ncbi:hypothetical protein Btru_058326 [Bulinus truncatus]|nr:hypothetical protein Btru_058326 [Bulinus truncatus]
MSPSQLSPRFVIFVIVSLVTHLLELAACGLFCHMLFQQSDLKAPWFSVSAGLVIIPLVAVQLASAVFILRRKGETSTSFEVTATAVLHILQLGFISRHFGILQESPLSTKRPEIVEMLLLRIAFAITSGCLVFLTQMYLMLRDVIEPNWMWAAYVSEYSLLVTITWAVSTFRRSLPEQDFDFRVVSWPGTVLRFVWRACELLCRAVALGLFGSIYTFWLLLVIGLHWLAMLICLCVPLMSSADWVSAGSLKRGVYCGMTSFTYIFVFINTSPENAVFRYTLYYVIIFLENATLVAIWLIQAPLDSFSYNCKYVYVAAFCCVASVASMTVYYKFFHIASDKAAAVCGNDGCDACKSGQPCEHPPIPPRPESAENWLSHCPVALYCSQDSKPDTLDSLLDSEINSNVTISSPGSKRNWPAPTVRSLRSAAAGTAGVPATLSSAPGSYHCDNRSHKMPVWLPSVDSTFSNQLLTCSLETFNTADDERSSVATSFPGHSLSRTDSMRKFSNSNTLFYNVPPTKSLDHKWFSDGYSTDLTDLSHVSSRRPTWLTGDAPSNRVCNCLEHSHIDSEVSAIMRSVTADEPCVSNERHHRNMDGTTRQLHGKNVSTNHLSAADLARSQDISCAASVHEACTNWILNRSRAVSSPASDPSHGPSTKRKRSPKRKPQALNSKDKSTSQMYADTHDNSSSSKLPHDDDAAPASPSSPQPDCPADESVEQAICKTLKVHDRLHGTSSSITDPRLTVRVMHGDDLTLDAMSLGGKTSLADNNRQVSKTTAAKDERRHAERSQRVDNDQNTSGDIPGGDSHDLKESDPTDVFNVIYENIWQVRHTTQTPSNKVSSLTDPKLAGREPGLTEVKGTLIRSNRERDFGYICSESEDSALPPEIMNSSVDCFTPSETESDFSMEIVI